MFSETRWKPESLVTFTAFVFLYTSMSEHVFLKISNFTEWFIALCTFVQLFSCMSKHVVGLSTGTGEWFDTQGARVFEDLVKHLSAVSCQVNLQIISATESFLALSTNLWLLSCVSQQMRIENTGICERLFTQGARVFVGHLEKATVLIGFWTTTDFFPVNFYFPLHMLRFHENSSIRILGLIICLKNQTFHHFYVSNGC